MFEWIGIVSCAAIGIACIGIGLGGLFIDYEEEGIVSRPGACLLLAGIAIVVLVVVLS